MFEKIITKNEIKFNELEKKIYKFVCTLGCELLKMYIEKYDEKLMKTRDKEKYRHKGKRKNTVKTLMGEIEYERAMYVVKEDGKMKYEYLLDEALELTPIGKISENLAEAIVEVAVNTTSYRKAEENIKNITNESISHEGIREVVLKLGEKITKREKEEIKHYEEKELVKGTKEVSALFEESDGIWINLQGVDREKALKKQASILFQQRLDLVYSKFSRKIPYPTLTIRKMKSRWGVCNVKTKRITLNLELMKKLEVCLDYVIVHELSHLVYADHSSKFWSLVEENYPDYKKVRKLLKEY